MENLLNSNLFIIVSIFSLSLVGAVVLFKFFENTAMVKSKQFQAGGAIAGFIIIFILLTNAYAKLKNDTVEKLKEELETARMEIERANHKLTPACIDGVITPYEKDAKIVLAVQQTDADMTGRFKFSAICVDPDNDDVKLYLISPTNYKFMRIDSKQSMRNINFPTK